MLLRVVGNSITSIKLFKNIYIQFILTVSYNNLRNLLVREE
jgi:hypothetical protein